MSVCFAWIIKVFLLHLMMLLPLVFPQPKILEVKQMERYDFIVSQILKSLRYPARSLKILSLNSRGWEIKKQFSQTHLNLSAHLVACSRFNNRNDRNFYGVCKQKHLTFIASLKSTIHLASLLTKAQ